jgi:hypothetical protein
VTGLNEQRIPADLLPQARTWFAKEMRRLEKAHGEAWPNTRDWIADYLNAELAERVDARRSQ